jgi:hypothetical protein
VGHNFFSDMTEEEKLIYLGPVVQEQDQASYQPISG